MAKPPVLFSATQLPSSSSCCPKPEIFKHSFLAGGQGSGCCAGISRHGLQRDKWPYFAHSGI
jgi:hypothetical protein